MREYSVIDADSHVEEPVEAWIYLDAKYQDRQPLIVSGENRPGLFGLNSFWYVDGKTYPHPVGRGATFYATPVTQERAKWKPYSLGSQTLTDPKARVKDLDDAGLGVQVLFPSLFLEPLTEDAGFEAALMRSYNTYLAAQCALQPDRLRWAALLPLRSPSAAAAEVQRAKASGATCFATTQGTLGDRLLEDPSLDSVWEAVEKSGLPLCIHCGWCNPGITHAFDTSYGSHVLGFTLPVLMAFYAFTGGGILDRFPGSSWASRRPGASGCPTSCSGWTTTSSLSSAKDGRCRRSLPVGTSASARSTSRPRQRKGIYRRFSTSSGRTGSWYRPTCPTVRPERGLWKRSRRGRI